MKNTPFKKTLISAVMISTLIATPTFAFEADKHIEIAKTDKAAEHTKNENIGFGSGFVIGGIVAGPIGAIVAGLTGTFIAQHVNAKDDIEALTFNLANQDAKYQEELNVVSQSYQQKLLTIEQNYQSELLALEQSHEQKGNFTASQLNVEKLLMSLQFKTGSSDIEPHYQEQVAALAEILNNSPALKIDLSGYTDLTGEAEVNKALSLARVDSVKALLMAQGVNDEQITTFSYGAEAPVVANEEKKVSFYDRRVVMKLHNKDVRTQTQTANHNE